MLRTGPIIRFRDAADMTVQDLPSSWGSGMGAMFTESFMGSPGPLAWRAGTRGLDGATVQPPDQTGIMPGEIDALVPQRIQDAAAATVRMLSADQAQATFGIGDLKFEEPISETEARDLYEEHKAMLRRQDIIRRSEIGGFEKFVAGLAGAALDPVNIAAAYFPAAIIGWSARSATVIGRAGFGLAEGAIGSAPVAGLTYALSKGEQRPYDLADAFIDVTFGSLLGAGLHVGIGAYKDWRKGLKPLAPIEAALQAATPQQRVQLLRGAVADVLEGRPVSVGPLVRLAMRDFVIQETSKLRAAGARIGAEDMTALARLMGVEEKLLPEIEGLNARIAQLEQERAGIGVKREQIAEELAPDTATADRLAEIDTELSTPNLASKRREALQAERRLLTEGATPEENLDVLRARVEEGGLAKAGARAEKRLAGARQTKSRVERSLRQARDDFKRASGRSASRGAILQALAERTLRRAAYGMKAELSAAEIAAAARRILTAKDVNAAVAAELDAIAARSNEGAFFGPQEPDPWETRGEQTSRDAVAAEIAKRQASEYYDQQDVAVDNAIDDTIETTPSFRKREPEEGIGSTTQAVEELKALDAEVATDIAEFKRLGILTAGEQAALDEAGEAVSKAQAVARVRDMAAMCLISMPESGL